MAYAQEEDVIDVTSRQLASAQNLPPDLMLLKMENESIMAVARAVPRDPLKIVAQLKQLIDAYPAAADEAIYSKPVGTVTEITCQCGIKYEVSYIDKDTTVCPACEAKPSRDARTRKVKKFAEGLSIRAAESIRSIFGYTRLATTCDIRPDGSAKITGVLVDYAAGNVTSDERIVSPYYKSKTGAMVKTPEDRFIGVVVKAEKSKLRRDVILDSTPAIVKALFRDECEKKMLELVAPEVIEQKILPAFLERGISVEHLEKLVGRPRKLGWREEERLELRKILTALKNEETTVAELLADLDDKSSAPTGPVKADDLTKGHSNGNGTAGGTTAAVEKPVTNEPAETAPESKLTETEGASVDELADVPETLNGITGLGPLTEYSVERAKSIKGEDAKHRFFAMVGSRRQEIEAEQAKRKADKQKGGA
jgi:hypothetical protein